MPDSANNSAQADRGLLGEESHSNLLETGIHDPDIQKGWHQRSIKLPANHTPTGAVQDLCSCHTQPIIFIPRGTMISSTSMFRRGSGRLWMEYSNIPRCLRTWWERPNDTKRTMIVTLLDLRNAFGEVNHRLIYSSLRYHYVPEEIISIIKDIYTHSLITVASTAAQNSELIRVERGVLQGDPCSPLIFNICFNPLMQAVVQAKYEHLGYMWGPTAELRSRSWLQFADDTVLISDSIKSAQSLLNLNAAWLRMGGNEDPNRQVFHLRNEEEIWELRAVPADTCCQRVAHSTIERWRAIQISWKTVWFWNEEWSYQGRIGQATDVTPRNNLGTWISNRNKNWRYWEAIFQSRITFELRVYDISYTWINQVLDSKISNAVRDWMELPISSCVSEILSLPASKGGLDISSLKETAEKLRLGQRFKLQSSVNDEMRVLFEMTSDQNRKIDDVIHSNSSHSKALQQMKENHTRACFEHIGSLNIQGRIISSISEHLKRSEISRWTKELDKLAAPLFNFVRKAIRAATSDCRESGPMGEIARSTVSIVQELQPNQQARSLKLWIAYCPRSLQKRSWCDSEDSCGMDHKPYQTGLRDICGSTSRTFQTFVKYLPNSWDQILRFLNARGIVTLELTICHGNKSGQIERL